MTGRIVLAILAVVLPLAGGAQAADPPPYQADLLRMAEVVGAITWLDGLCGDADAEVWRIKMQGILDAQTMTPEDRRIYVDAYNRGYLTFAAVHTACSDRTRAVLARYFQEGSALTERIIGRFGRRGPGAGGAAAAAPTVPPQE